MPARTSHQQLGLFDPPAPPPPSAGSAAGPVRTETRGLRNAQALPANRAGQTVVAIPTHDRRVTFVRGSPQRRQTFYEALVEELKAQYKISIRKWRKHMSGVAYEIKYRDGRIKRLITAPRPRSPVSAAIFLHEVGHHAIGFKRYKPRCLEEFYVWQWTFREMTARNIPLEPRVLRHYKRSMFHYVRTAKRRGIKELPHELHQFLHWPG